MSRPWFILSILSIALLGAAGAAFAEDIGPPPLSLRECIDLAQQQQTDILTGKNDLVSAKARQTQSQSSYFPQVSVTTNAFKLGSSTPVAGRTTGTTLSVNQTLYDGGIREASIRGAKASILSTTYGLDRTRQMVTYAVTRDYFALLRAQKLAEVAASKVKYLEGQLALVQARVQAGDAAEVDALPVEASLANARVDRLATTNAVRTAGIQLQQTIGLKIQAQFAVQDYTADPAPAQESLDAYLKVAQAARPDYLQAKAGITTAKSSVDASKIKLLPYPFISGQYDQPFRSANKDTLSITGGLVFDLFDGGSNRAAYHQAQANLSNAELRAAQLQKDIEADVQSAYLTLQNAKERLDASALSEKAAQKNMDAQEERYKQGLAIPLDLLNAQVNVVTAQSTAVQARYDYYTALAQLEYATGQQGGLYGK